MIRISRPPRSWRARPSPFRLVIRADDETSSVVTHRRREKSVETPNEVPAQPTRWEQGNGKT